MVDSAEGSSHDGEMVVPGWIGLVRGRRQRGDLAARKVARGRAVQQLAQRREEVHHQELPVVPSQGDLICFNAAIHPC